MSARDDLPFLADAAAKRHDRRLVNFEAADALDEIDRLRDENQRLREGGAQLAVERDELRRWQQEACEWMTKHIGLTHSLYEQKVDLLRRAGQDPKGRVNESEQEVQ